MNSPHQAKPVQPRHEGQRIGARIGVFLAISGLGIFADLYSKRLVFENLGYPGGQSRPFLDSWVMFRFHTSFNRGALWGVGQNLTPLFAVLSILAVGIILYWLFVRGAIRSWLLTICLAAILAGTVGNLYDRLGLHGYQDPLSGERIFAVRDFLLFRLGSFYWPVFNLADVLLVVGAVSLIVQSLWSELRGETASAL